MTEERTTIEVDLRLHSLLFNLNTSHGLSRAELVELKTDLDRLVEKIYSTILQVPAKKQEIMVNQPRPRWIENATNNLINAGYEPEESAAYVHELHSVIQDIYVTEELVDRPHGVKQTFVSFRYLGVSPLGIITPQEMCLHHTIAGWRMLERSACAHYSPAVRAHIDVHFVPDFEEATYKYVVNRYTCEKGKLPVAMFGDGTPLNRKPLSEVKYNRLWMRVLGVTDLQVFLSK